MKKNILMVGVATGIGLAGLTLLPAQEPSTAIQLKEGKQKGFNSLAVNGNTVTGAPYTAEAVTETTQTLGDGNRIAQTSSVKLYRDGQGRERQDEGRAETTRILISDPVSRVSFTLDPRTHTGQKSPIFGQREVAAAVNKLELATLNFVYIVNGETGTLYTRRAPGSPDPATEQQRPRTIEGVFATGTRTTVTIPAGQIGNLLPIEVVDEAWYSPDLQMNVMTKHSDPRTGEVVYQLKNISRGEPDPSLFQVPPDYKITEMGGKRRPRGCGTIEV